MFIKRILLATIPELSLGVLLVFSSNIGQTFFISLFSGEIRNEFNLSHGMFGIFYSVATLTSAVVFFWLGKLTDQFNLTLLGLITPVSYTHLRAHETGRNLVCRLLLEKKKQITI